MMTQKSAAEAQTGLVTLHPLLRSKISPNELHGFVEGFNEFLRWSMLMVLVFMTLFPQVIVQMDSQCNRFLLEIRSQRPKYGKLE